MSRAGTARTDSDGGRVVVTGGTGFVGRRVVVRLHAQHPVAVISRDPAAAAATLAAAGADIRCYGTDDDELERVFSDGAVSAVIHLAACYRKRHLATDVAPMIDSNLRLPALLLDRMVRAGCRRFVTAGSYFEYRCGDDEATFDATLEPRNLYAATKSALTELVRFFVVEHALRAMTLRLFNVYGPGDARTKLLPAAVEHFGCGTTLATTSGSQQLDWVHVADVADAFVRALDRTATMAPGHDQVDIGSGVAVSVRDLLERLARAGGVECTAAWGALREPPDEIRYARADVARAAALLDWQPQTTLDAGLASLWAAPHRRPRDG